MTDLINQDKSLSYVQRPDNSDDVGDMVKVFNFHAILKLYSSGTGEVKKNHIPMNHYGYKPEKDKLESLGLSVVVVPLTWRYCATKFELNPSTKKWTFWAYYDKNTPEFADIRTKSTSKVKDIRDGHSSGFDFLCWVPKAERLMRVQLLNPTNCQIQPKLDMWLGEAVVLNSRTIEANGNVWQGMTAVKYVGEPLGMPSQAEGQQAVSDFSSCKSENNESDDAEVVPETETASRG